MEKLFPFLFLLVLANCAIRKNLETPLLHPENKSVTDKNFCSAQPDGTFNTDEIKFELGFNDRDGSAWALGGGCIARPIRETWAALHNLDVMKFEGADEYHLNSAANPTPEFTHIYKITYSKTTVAGDIDWTLQWMHGIGAGTFAEPESININFQRISGTSLIPIWWGGIVLRKVTSTVTGLAILNQFKARQSSSDNQDSARDGLQELVEHARNGAPDWTRLANRSYEASPSESTPLVPSEIVATVECRVSHPDTIEDIFPLKIGDVIKAESGIKTSDMTINGAEGLKNFPAVIRIDRKGKFSLQGQKEEHGGKLKFSMSGKIGGDGKIYFNFSSNTKGGTHMEGSARLNGCQKI